MNSILVINIFVVIYVFITLLMGLKRFFPNIQHYFGNHPFGNWAMYSLPVEIEPFTVLLKSIITGHDVEVTSIAKEYLWHNFENGEFVSLAHPDIPYKVLIHFPKFISKQSKVIKIKQQEYSDHECVKIILNFNCTINHVTHKLTYSHIF